MARKELSAAAKETARQYDNINYSVIGTKLTREKADQFRTLCKSSGVSVSAALSVFVRACLQSGSLDVIRDDVTTAAGSIRDDDGRAVSVDPAFPQGDQANRNDTPGTVDLSTANDTPGSVCRPPVSDTPGTVD